MSRPAETVGCHVATFREGRTEAGDILCIMYAVTLFYIYIYIYIYIIYIHTHNIFNIHIYICINIYIYV